MKISFDHELYLKEQTDFILERVRKFNNKLYLEFGGKLFYDFHAARVLPGFDVNAKVKLLSKLKEKAEIIICVYAGDIERNKIRADFGITYDMDVMKLIDDLREWGLDVNSVVITRYSGQPAAAIFKNKLERRGIKAYTHQYTKGYPVNVDTIVSDEGYGANQYIETHKPLVVVTAPGPGSGKLATCLSQLYHEYRRGIKAGYSKFETFPIWNLPLKHPVNVAYEAATADLKDVNMIDPFHLEAYNTTTINYNRDIEVFPVLKRILEKITGVESIYKSPTDMGVNRAGFGISDDRAAREAAEQEIIRRYFRNWCDYRKGYIDLETAQRVELIMEELNIKPESRKVVLPARFAVENAGTENTGINNAGMENAGYKDIGIKNAGTENTGINNDGIENAGHKDIDIKVAGTENICGNIIGMAIMLTDGRVITGKNSKLMTASSSAILNSIKTLANIADEIHLLSPMVLDQIISLKRDSLCSKNPVLNLEEILIALSISAATNPAAQMGINKLIDLRGCEAHCSKIVHQDDDNALRKLGINLTCDAEFPTKDLFFV